MFRVYFMDKERANEIDYFAYKYMGEATRERRLCEADPRFEFVAIVRTSDGKVLKRNRALITERNITRFM